MNGIVQMEIELISNNRRSNSKFIIVILVMTFLLFSAVSAKADSTNPPQENMINSSASGQTFTIYLENDGTFLKPQHRTDRHYTAGLKLVYTHQPDCNWLKGFAGWNKFAPENEQVHTAVGYFLGQDIFTPDHVGHPELRKGDDRVFAGWLYGGVFVQRAKEDQMEHFELNLGVIGPSALAEESQRDVHRFIGADKPHGWENQLNDEFAADFTYFKRQRADAITFKRTENFDSHIEYGFTAGSVHRNATLSVLFRGGVNLPNDFGPGRLEAPACATDKTRDDLTHLYLFTRLGGKLVEFDRFLTGLSEKPLVGVLQVGVGWRYKFFEMTYSQTFMTKEYDEQHGEDSYGSLTLSYRF
jgi:lipid A 3-O-deacylase